MKTFPFHDRLDVTVASLLVAQRHRALANRTVTSADVARDVLDLVDHIDVDADDLGDLEEFQEAVEESLGKLVAAKWLSRRVYSGVVRYQAPAMADSALEWIQSRLSVNPRKLRAFSELARDVNVLVLQRYGEHINLTPRSAS